MPRCEITLQGGDLSEIAAVVLGLGRVEVGVFSRGWGVERAGGRGAGAPGRACDRQRSSQAADLVFSLPRLSEAK
jgi:hypothetical protein